jgi:hypothetical protein
MGSRMVDMLLITIHGDEVLVAWVAVCHIANLLMVFSKKKRRGQKKIVLVEVEQTSLEGKAVGKGK